MLIRQVKPEELEEYYQGDRYAYFNGDGKEAEPEWLMAMAANQIWAVFVDGKMVGGLILWRFEQVVRGRIEVMGGIAGVWSYPEFRDRGYVRALVEKVVIQMPQLGMSVSMLLPFKQSFYQRLGYVAANANLKLKIPLAGLAHHLKLSLENWRLARLPTIEVRDLVQAFLQEVVLSNLSSDRWHGQVLANLDLANWNWRYRGSQTVILVKDEQIQAIANYTIDSQKEFCINIKERFWQSVAARDRLFRFFASHRDQIQDLELEVSLGENFYAWLEDLPKTSLIKLNPHPWMVRVVDAVVALSGLKASYESELVVMVQGNNLDTRIAIACNGRELTVEKTQEPWQVWLDLAGLTALVYGTRSVTELIDAQQLKFSPGNESELEVCQTTLENWFPGLLLYNSFYY